MRVVQSIDSSVRNWWLALLEGLLFFGVGVWILFSPVASFAAMVLFFSVFMLVSGVFGIVFALSNSGMQGWGWYLVLGMLDLMIGAYLLFNPALTALVLPFIIAFWLMFHGFSSIGFSIELSRMGVRNWGLYLFLGVLIVISSLFIIWNPLAGAVMAVYVMALSFLLNGIFVIMHALAMRRANRELADI